MKKLLFLVTMTISLSCFSQDYDLKNVERVKFFGIDYSHVQVYGAKETPQQFHYIFERINDLMITEPKKYDASNFLRKNVYETSVNEVNQKIREMDITNLATTDKNLYFTQEDLQNILYELPAEPEQGIGVVFIAELLNKVDLIAYYHVVFFDMENKQLISSWEGKGKPRGYGLRNFWAGSVYKMMKSNRIYYK